MTAPRIEMLGIDLGKRWCHLVGIDTRGEEVMRRKLGRAKLSEFAAELPRSVVAMESCSGLQRWGRVFAVHGHEVRIIPSRFVKPYVKTNKNDFDEAAAVAEAAGRGSMHWPGSANRPAIGGARNTEDCVCTGPGGSRSWRRRTGG